MKHIQLTNGGVALVDDEDFESLNIYRWRRVDKSDSALQYAVRSEGVYKQGTFRLISMHRAVIDAQSGQIVDHKNGDGLDNRRSNLRICTHAENMRNQKSQGVAGKSQYKGVQWDRRGKNWRARIYVNKQPINGGNHLTEADAAKAYDNLASQHFGEFARLNFPTL